MEAVENDESYCKSFCHKQWSGNKKHGFLGRKVVISFVREYNLCEL